MTDKSTNSQEIDKVFDEINRELGGALGYLKSKDNVVGRDNEILDLQGVLARRVTPVAALIADAGVGKTALVEFLKHLLEQKSGKRVYMLQLKVGIMASDGQDILLERMNTLLDKLKRFQDTVKKHEPESDVVLFIDEVHMVVSIFGKGSKIGGDLLKETLARAEDFISVVTATTPDEYQAYIAGDKALRRRFKPVRIPELSPSQTLGVLKNWLKQNSKPDEDLYQEVPEYILMRIINANRTYRADEAEPAKSIDVLASLIARRDVRGEKIDDKLLGDVFNTEYNINLNFDVDPFKAMDSISKRVLGQPLALYTIENDILRLAFRADDKLKRPRASYMFAGTTGTGKTELAKSIAEAIFGDDHLLMNFSMTKYASEGSNELFLREVGKAVSNNLSAVLLLDEIEKAHTDIRNSLLPMLDEGMLTYTDYGVDGSELIYDVSLKNTIIILTSNAGSNAMANINRFNDNDFIGEEMNNELVEASRNISKQMESALGSTLRPEFLQRFDSIVPFVALHHNTLLRIARKKVISLLKMIYVEKGIYVNLPKGRNYEEYGYSFDDGYGYYDNNGEERFFDSISMYIVVERMASTSEANKNGARMIDKIIKSDIYPTIIRATFKHKNEDVFYLDTNGYGLFETKGHASSKAEIEVLPRYLTQ